MGNGQLLVRQTTWDPKQFHDLAVETNLQQPIHADRIALFRWQDNSRWIPDVSSRTLQFNQSLFAVNE